MNEEINMVESIEEKNELFRECKRDDVPYIALECINEDFWCVSYDLIAVNCMDLKLNADTRERIEGIFSDSLKEILRENMSMAAGDICGCISKLRLEEAKEIYQQILPLIKDRSNWVIDFSYYSSDEIGLFKERVPERFNDIQVLE